MPAAGKSTEAFLEKYRKRFLSLSTTLKDLQLRKSNLFSLIHCILDHIDSKEKIVSEISDQKYNHHLLQVTYTGQS